MVLLFAFESPGNMLGTKLTFVVELTIGSSTVGKNRKLSSREQNLNWQYFSSIVFLK